MATLALTITPNPVALPPLGEAQLCYALVAASAAGTNGARPVNWAFVADASRSMRIPIVDEAQFRALVRSGGAQETLVDGVPVWQLSGPVPPEVRAASKSALDHVAHALHTVVERLDGNDRFALAACAEEALLLTRSTPGGERVELVRGISRLKSLNLGEQTDLSHGLALGLQELRRGRDGQRAERLLLLTDGFTQRPEACLRLAGEAAAEGVMISTVGLGGEFQDDVLTAIADSSGGRALFLRRPSDIPKAIGQELDIARAVAARAASLAIAPAAGVTVRRVTRIRPVLSTLLERPPGARDAPAVRLGDLAAGAPVTLLVELLVPPALARGAPIARLSLEAENLAAASATLTLARHNFGQLPEEVRAAAARANIARLQRRALDAAGGGEAAEAVRLLRAAADRLTDLGEHALAELTRNQAAALERAGRASSLATKELTYATRRLGEDER